jgi:hypothetical protein
VTPRARSARQYQMEVPDFHMFGCNEWVGHRFVGGVARRTVPPAGGGREVAWALGTGGVQHRATHGEAEEREGRTPLDRPHRPQFSRADTVVSIEREVVSGHAYAILAPGAVCGGRCGHDKPANVPVDGV